MSAVTTHVLDTARGVPAAGVQVWLEHVSADGPAEIARTQRLAPGTYRLVFDTAEYLAGLGSAERGPFFPEVAITFTADAADGEMSHYHVPLLLSPFGYSTYRGS